jgi:transposase
VDTLRREGVSIPAIAKLFGVTHQRVSNLLRRPSD